MASNEQVKRLLALVPYLQARPEGAGLAETAAAFAVSPKQLLADLDVLWYCGLPGGLPDDLIDIDMEGARGGWIALSNADFLDRPLRFTPDEALSLSVALQLVHELAGPEVEAAVESALAKLSVARAVRPAPVVVSVASGSAEVRQLLTDAIEAGSIVELTYDGQTRAETTMPRVEPKRLSVRDGYGYLDAWSLDRNAWRVYRLDRIAAAQVVDGQAEDRGEAPGFGSGWLDQLTDAADVTLVLDASAAWITEYIPVRSSLATAEGLVVTLRVADPAWLRAQLLRLGSGVVRVDPSEAAESARHAAREALALY